MKDSTSKRKILTDRKFPDSAQIAKHQDFERLQADYTVVKKLLLKKILLWSGAVLATASIAGFVMFKSMNTAPALPLKAQVAAAPTENYIKAPVPGMDIPFNTYRISVKEGGTIQYPTGSSLVIPPDAFVSGDGKDLGDSVDIKYREFHDPLSIFLSGIPMHYDSAGVNNTLESAGMLEILAFDEGKSLSLKAQKPIRIKMASKNAEERFNLYELDTIQKNWIYKGKDKVEKFTAEKTKSVKKHSSVAVEEKYIQPAMADPGKFTFKIDYNAMEFSELSAYENVLFEVTDKNFKPSYYKVNWNKISVRSGAQEGEYLIQLKKADTTISVRARPVFGKEDYARALAKFQEKNKQITMKQDQEEFDKQAALSKVNKELSAYNSKMLTASAGKLNGTAAYRTFSILSLGVHNIDFPIPSILQYAFSFKRTKPLSVPATPTNKNTVAPSGEFTYSTIFLVEKGKNTVFRFAKGEPVRCNPSAKNLMWTMTDKNQVAFFRIADYNKLVNGAENTIDPIVAQNQALAFEEIKKFSE
jgi:hypothetical protein